MSSIELRPISLKDAQDYINRNHRHHKAPIRWKFGVSAWVDGVMVGVAMAGRPVARGLDDGVTLEVTRLCSDGTPNVPSKLYGAIARAGHALGYKRIYTYILDSEPGTTLVAAGWEMDAKVKGRSWSCPSRPRIDKHPTVDKTRWLHSMKEAA